MPSTAPVLSLNFTFVKNLSGFVHLSVPASFGTDMCQRRAGRMEGGRVWEEAVKEARTLQGDCIFEISCTTHLCAVSCFGLQPVHSHQILQQTCFLVPSFNSLQLETGVRLLQNQLDADGKSGHVNSEGTIRVKDGFPAHHLPCWAHFWGFISQPPNESHRPDRDPPRVAHLCARKRQCCENSTPPPLSQLLSAPCSAFIGTCPPPRTSYTITLLSAAQALVHLSCCLKSYSFHRHKANSLNSKLTAFLCPHSLLQKN